MVDILFIRHAQSTWNAAGRAQGWSDPPLSDLGQTQAQGLAARLGAELDLRAVGASDLQRARQTAEAIAAASGRGPVRVDARWRERELGWWSGREGREVERRWGPEAQAWREHRLERPPGGESDAMVHRRVVAALTEWAGQLNGGLGLVVSHGGVISVLERAVGLSSGGRGHGNLTGRWLRVEGDQVEVGAYFDPEERLGGPPITAGGPTEETG